MAAAEAGMALTRTWSRRTVSTPSQAEAADQHILAVGAAFD